MDGVPTNPDMRPAGDTREDRHTATLNWATVQAGQTITVPEGARVTSNRYAFTGGMAHVISIENASADGHAMVRPTHEPRRVALSRVVFGWAHGEPSVQTRDGP